jgi:hypothetical protein
MTSELSWLNAADLQLNYRKINPPPPFHHSLSAELGRLYNGSPFCPCLALLC